MLEFAQAARASAKTIKNEKTLNLLFMIFSYTGITYLYYIRCIHNRQIVYSLSNKTLYKVYGLYRVKYGKRVIKMRK